MDTATLAALATATCYMAAVRAHDMDGIIAAHGGDDAPFAQPMTLDAATAASAAGIASVALMLLFYWFDAVAWLLVLSTLVTATAGAVLLVAPWMQSPRRSLGLPELLVVPWFGATAPELAATAVLASVVNLAWLWTNHWILNNVLGVSLVVAFVAIGRVPSGRVAAILLLGLLVYDVFWVYLSPFFFGGQNVMVEVATRTADNPLARLAGAMNLERPASMSHDLALPAKLIVPSWTGSGGYILGLGDMAVPALLLSLLYRLGQARVGAMVPLTAAKAPLRPFLYFYTGLGGYAIGIVVTLMVADLWRAAQPALLFLVPATVAPVLAIAVARREVALLWHPLPIPATGGHKDGLDGSP